MNSLLQHARDEQARRRLRYFVRDGWHVLEPTTPYVHGRHIEVVSEHLEAVTAGQIQNLIINIPPGHMKSLHANVFWLAWMWIQRPSLRVLCASYASNLTRRDSRKFRALITSTWYQRVAQKTIELSKDTEDLLINAETGFRQCMSVDGETTGNRGDGMVIDDALNATDSLSDAARAAMLWWWDQGMANRLNDLVKGWRVVIGQRLHEDDLPGHVLKEGCWEHLCLPSEFVRAKACVTKIGGDWRQHEGELLFPDRFPAAVLAVEKKRLGSYGYSGQHQQSPTPADGGKFRRSWFRYFEQVKDHYVLHTPEGDRRIWIGDCWIFQTVDLALSAKEGADFTVIATWVVTKQNELLLLDVERMQQESPEVKAALTMSKARFKPLFQAIENAHYGTEVCQDWLRKGYPLKKLEADRDKVTRSIQASLLMENGRVYFHAGTSWLVDYETELLGFPNATHDDQVDVTSYAAMCIANQEAQTVDPRETEDLLDYMDSPE